MLNAGPWQVTGRIGSRRIWCVRCELKREIQRGVSFRYGGMYLCGLRQQRTKGSPLCQVWMLLVKHHSNGNGYFKYSPADHRHEKSSW